MTRRNSPNDFKMAEDLSRLSDIVVDKRADAKAGRRNRHYEKQFLANAVKTGLYRQTSE